MTSTTQEFRDIAPQLWQLLGDIETLASLPVEGVKFTRYSSAGREVLVYLDEREIPLGSVLRSLDRIADYLGVQLDTGRPYRTETQPSGQGVCITMRTSVESMPVVLKALLDADAWAKAVAEQAAAGVAA
jgi:hypothetical protein